MTEPRPVVAAEHRRQRRRSRLTYPVVAVACALFVVMGLALLVMHSQIDGLSKALTAQCQQTKRLGHKCVAAPAASVRANPAQPTVSPQPGPAGPQGPGPTDAQIQTAVAAYFAAHPVINDTPPSPSVVQAFVTAYLVAHPAPQGSPGPAGSPGSTGQTGATGATGANGRGIFNIACNDTHLVVTYDDSAGTTQDLGSGSCGQGPQGPQGEPGKPVASYSYTVHGPLGDTSYTCTWDGESETSPHYDCSQQ